MKEFGLFSKKDRKRMQIKENQEKGRLGEAMFVLGQQASGHEVIRTGKGHDYKVRKRGPWTGKVVKTEYIEVKSSRTAPTSKLQNKTKEKLKGRYKVARPIW